MLSFFKKILEIKIILLVCLVVFILSFYVRFHNSQYIYADQVHYLIMSHSLLDDGDFNLKNDYTSKKYLSYFNDELDPHVPKSQLLSDSPEWYSLHNPGLSIFIAPFIYIMGWKGAILAMILVNFMLLGLVYLWVKKNLNNNLIATLSALLLFASSFYLGLVGYIFPDLLIATVFLGSILLMEKSKKTKLDYLLISLLLGGAIWIHIKTALIVFTIGIIALFELLTNKKPLNKKWGELFFLIFPALILLVLFEWKLFEWYGTFLPTKTFAADQMFKLSPLYSLSKMLFDSAKGFLTNNPAYFICLIGLPLWAKFSPGKFLKLMIIVLPSFLLQSTFGDWSGGFSPPGRYLLEIFPLLIPAIGFAILAVNKNLALKSLIIILSLAQFIFLVFFIIENNKWTL